MQPLQLKSTLDSFRPRLQQEIQSCLTLLQANLGPWPNDPTQEHYWQRLRSFAVGGKLRRGELLLLTFKRTHGERAVIAYRLGAWLEILHSGFLIHDDIIDNDNHRRGRPSYHAFLSKIYPEWTASLNRTHHTPEQAGKGLALAIGEYLISAAASEIKFLDLPENILGHIIARWDQTILDTMAGQIRDITSNLPTEINKEHILETARLKTSAYSFSLPLYCSGQLTGLPQHMCERLAQLGNYLGICLQLQDDEDGLLKSRKEIGKTPGTDLRDNTITLWRWYLEQLTDPPEKHTLNQIVGSPIITEDKLEFVRYLYRKYDLEFVREVHQERLLKKARRLIKNTDFPEFLKDRLYALATIDFIQ